MKKHLKNTALLLVALAGALWTAPATLFAQTDSFEPLTIIPGVTDSTSLASLLQGLFTLSIALAAVLAVIMLTIGGFKYMTSEGPGDKSKGKEDMLNAVLGLALILGGWLILSQINPTILNLGFFDDGTYNVGLPQGGGVAGSFGNTIGTFTIGENGTVEELIQECNDRCANYASYCTRYIYTCDTAVECGQAGRGCSGFSQTQQPTEADPTFIYESTGSNPVPVLERGNCTSQCIGNAGAGGTCLPPTVSGDTVQCNYQAP